MAIIQLPTGLKIERLTIGQQRYDLDFSNSDTGSGSTRLLGPPRWKVSFSSAAEMDIDQASAWVATMVKLRGRVNHLAVWDVARPVPRGTMRGTLTLSASAAAGSTSLTITGGAGQAGRTLLAHDWLQLGVGVGTSQLVMVTEDVTADGSGVVTLTVEPPLRTAFSAGAPVTWDRPLGYYKSTTQHTEWTYERAVQGGISFDGIERWEN